MSNIQGQGPDIAFKPLKRGETVEFQWVEETKLDESMVVPGKLRCCVVTPRTVVEHSRVSVHFTPQVRPSDVWRVDGITFAAATKGRPAGAEHLTLDENLTAEATKSWPTQGFSYGVGFTWANRP